MKYIYPAVFSPVDEGGFAIWFPDLPGTNSQGKDWEEVLYMARDSLASWIEYLVGKGMDIPDQATPPR